MRWQSSEAETWTRKAGIIRRRLTLRSTRRYLWRYLLFLLSFFNFSCSSRHSFRFFLCLFVYRNGSTYSRSAPTPTSTEESTPTFPKAPSNKLNACLRAATRSLHMSPLRLPRQHHSSTTVSGELSHRKRNLPYKEMIRHTATTSIRITTRSAESTTKVTVYNNLWVIACPPQLRIQTSSLTTILTLPLLLSHSLTPNLPHKRKLLPPENLLVAMLPPKHIY